MLANVFNVPKHEVARIICEVLASSNSINLKEVHLVSTMDHILPLIGGAFLEMSREEPSNEYPNVTQVDQNVITSAMRRRLKRKPSQLAIGDRVKVFISCDDITKLKVDAIVCSNDKQLSCSKGLAKRIAKLIGKQYKKKCKQAARGNILHTSDAVSIKTNRLGVIINVVVPRLSRLTKKIKKHDADTYKNLLSASFKKAFDEARKCGVSCLAVSPLGAGKVMYRTWETTNHSFTFIFR